MEIIKTIKNNIIEAAISGRLDAYWSEHLSRELSEILRTGADKIYLNAKQINYISSAGVRVLLQYSKKLKELNGEFYISEPSDSVKSILEMTGLTSLILNPAMQKKNVLSGNEIRDGELKEYETESFNYRLSKSESAKPLIGNIAGKPDFLNLKSNEAYKSRALEFSKNKYGIGIGAFGESFEECKSRFGEYAALNGTAAYLPSGSGNAPDFIISSGNLIPKINILYGFTMTGDFDSYFRFESKDDKNGVKFSELIKTAVELSETGTAGIILVAETTGMVGVSLRKSPLLPEPESNSIFDYPQIRTNLNFTIEPAFKRCLTVTIGIADKNNNAVLNPFVRKISNNSDIYAHFHSLIFTYQPLRKNDIELDSTIASLFEKQSLLSILHLINDERNITGIGQSEFSRGVCWFAPVSLK